MVMKIVMADQLSEVLKGTPQPGREIIIRYGQHATIGWSKALSNYGIVVKQQGFDNRYEVLMDAVMNPNHEYWESVKNYFDLYLATADIPAPVQVHSSTSVEAGNAIRSKSGTLRQQVLKALKEQPMTDWEITEYLGIEGSTARPRRIELVQMGLVQAVGSKHIVGHRRSTLWGAL